MVAGPAPTRRSSRARIAVRVFEAASGRACAARVAVLCSDGTIASPPSALQKRGTGRQQFYAVSTFEVDVPSGPTEILIERGTEYRPWRATVYTRDGDVVSLDAPLVRWFERHDSGLMVGNPHVHYDAEEDRLLDRLLLDPQVEDLDVLAVSHVDRRGAPYASNRLPIGIQPESTTDHVLDVGEECRHNESEWTAGYGHVIFIGISAPIGPLSRGTLRTEKAPDYPHTSESIPILPRPCT